MTIHSAEEREVARIWLRNSFQIPFSKNDARLDALLNDTKSAVMDLLSPKQKKKFEPSLTKKIAELQLQLTALKPEPLSPSTQAQHYWALDEASVLRMDRLIRESEQNFAALGETLRKKLPGKPHIPLLFQPFDLVKRNESFEHKNGIPLRIRTRQIELQVGNFIYDLLPDSVIAQQNNRKIELAAAFYARFRQMQLPADFNPQRLFDLLVKYHEVWHAHQDDWLRARYPDGVQALYEQKAHIMDFEMEAYAYMVELIDLHTDGEMQVRCKTPIKREDILWLHTVLQGTPGPTERFSEQLLYIGRRLWPLPGYQFTGTDNLYPADYERYIIESHPGPNRWKIDHSTGNINKIP